MLPSDYHNHPLGHDPNRRYDPETLAGWLSHAQAAGLSDVALTDHDRYHQGVDFGAFARFRDTLPAGMHFRLGIELDNDPETGSAGRRWVEQHYEQLEFILGSVHFIDDWAFDHPHYQAEFANWQIDQLYTAYYERIQATIREGIIDGLAHIDLIKIFGHRPAGDLTPLYRQTAKLIKDADLTIELSTAGWRKPVGELYPDDQWLQLIKDYQIPITIASDAHAPNHLAADYDRLAQILDRWQFKEVAVFQNHQRQLIPLT